MGNSQRHCHSQVTEVKVTSDVSGDSTCPRYDVSSVALHLCGLSLNDPYNQLNSGSSAEPEKDIR